MQLPYIMDIEASGLGKGSYPIEIGFVTPQEKTYCTLIYPHESWQHWDTSAEALHHIPRSILKRNGKDITYVCNWLNQILAGQTVYSDGWANDMCWLGKLFNEAEQTQKFKIESILTLLTEQEREQWTDVHNKIVASESLIRHRASSDALMILKTFKVLKIASTKGTSPLSNIKVS